MNKFDSVVMGALDIAQTEVLKRKNTELSVFHLLWGLLNNPTSISSHALLDYKEKITNELDSLAVSDSLVKLETIRPTSNLSEWLTLASGTATESGRAEVTEKDLLQHIAQVAPFIKIKRDILSSQDKNESVPEFLINLNQLAEEGRLDPVIGRTSEIRAVIEILGRRSKNNPVLVGPAGVGKTAIVEGLADSIIKGKVPEVIAGKTVYSLDMGALMAGTKFRGEFEERMQKLVTFIKESSGDSILFIDEMHQLVGAGKTEGAMDAANLLKPSLARGELHCIGATTPEEYQKYILNDAALDRRFRPVSVGEPSREDAIEIMLGIRDKLEMHHGIKISDEAIFSSVTLSSLYLTDKNLPDKSIDLVDEASSALKLSAEAMPQELADMESEIRSKKILSKVENNSSELDAEIAALQSTFDQAKIKWEDEVSSLKKLSSVKNSLDRVRFDLEKAEREGNYEEASKIKYGVLPELEKELESQQHGWVLSERHIAAVISRQTGIPIEKILRDRQTKMLELEPFLKQRVFGQDEALHEISETLLTAYAGISDQSRPMGSFLLMGPTGVGKTETAKALSQFLFDTEDNMIRLDMSEYSEKHSVAKLIGAPAGYVGYEEGGTLTEAIRRKPYSVILFDEIEKAHQDFADVLLQILDDGRLTDNKGRTINFKNTIVILTTNSKDLNQDFKPEVLGRLDAKLEFTKLDPSIMKKLVDKQATLLNDRLKQKKVDVSIHDSMLDQLCTTGYDSKFGARPLQSVFNRLVNRPLAKSIIKGELEPGSYRIELQEGQTKITEIMS